MHTVSAASHSHDSHPHTRTQTHTERAGGRERKKQRFIFACNNKAPTRLLLPSCLMQNLPLNMLTTALRWQPQQQTALGQRQGVLLQLEPLGRMVWSLHETLLTPALLPRRHRPGKHQEIYRNQTQSSSDIALVVDFLATGDETYFQQYHFVLSLLWQQLGTPRKQTVTFILGTRHRLAQTSLPTHTMLLDKTRCYKLQVDAFRTPCTTFCY